MYKDYAAEAVEGLEAVESLEDFCKDWKSKYRVIAATAQGILNVLYPPAGRVLGILITMADKFCASPGGDNPAPGGGG